MTQTRNTVQRKLVYETVMGRHDHPRADEIYEQVRLLDPHISRGTVYRNLHVLAGAGQIRALPMPEGADHYDYQLSNHYHFYCRKCGRVVNVDLPYNDSLNSISVGIPGYKTEWHRLIFVGLCADCAEN